MYYVLNLRKRRSIMMLTWQKLSVELCLPQADKSRSKGGLGEG